jgi:hypothetical protein
MENSGRYQFYSTMYPIIIEGLSIIPFKLKNIKTSLLLTVLICIPFFLDAQCDSSWKIKPSSKMTGFADVYYTYDFNKPKSEKRQSFLYNYNRHNALQINSMYLKYAIDHKKYRSNVACHLGTYVDDNYALEPPWLKNIFEANLGFSLNKTNSLWIDAGIFGSHIGFESASSTDNYNLTRSLLAENSPYYLSGVKLSYLPSGKIEMTALLLNGWQHLIKVKGNSLPSFGTQLKLMPYKWATFNWSTFIGTDDPDSIRRVRYFNNFYGQFKFSKKLGLTAGFDIGFQQKVKKSSNYYFWLSPILIVKYQLSPIWAASLRAEYYEDKQSVIISAINNHGFSSSGFSLNTDCNLNKMLLWRLEGRYLYSKDEIFERNASFMRSNFILTTAISIKLDKLLK